MKYVEIAYRYGTTEAAQRARPTSSDAARERLEHGSREFAELMANLEHGEGVARRVIGIDAAELGLGAHGSATPKQRPYAAIVGCSDARVPIELVFSEGPNDLFVVRIAGNGLGTDVLGSLKYAIEHLGDVKLIVVLGHSGCGAVSAAVDVFLHPAAYVPLLSKIALRGIIDRLLVVVHACAKRIAAQLGADVATRPGYRAALVEMAVATNAALAAFTIQQELGGVDPQQLRAVWATYVLDDRAIWAPCAGNPEHTGLARPPTSVEDFVVLADAIMASRRFTSLLETADNGPEPGHDRA